MTSQNTRRRTLNKRSARSRAQRKRRKNGDKGGKAVYSPTWPKPNWRKQAKARSLRERKPQPWRKGISIGSGSIHSSWMHDLGGMIRMYVESRQHERKEALEDIHKLYTSTGCSISKTKEGILSAFGAKKDADQSWVDLSMFVEKENLQFNQIEDAHTYDESNTRTGLKLKTMQLAGEGPVYQNETWTNVIVPSWAVGNAYFFEAQNNTPLNLSCEMTIDGIKVARNIPIPPFTTRSVRPDRTRYFQSHKWLLQVAKREKLKTQVLKKNTGNKKVGYRYNGKRPNYNSKRVSQIDFPDPVAFGWKFTGSVEVSRVEFFEKSVNMGVVKLDFYYSTGTVKTVLDHPTTGTNQLFRRCKTDPEMFRKILQNPRFYRTREQIPLELEDETAMSIDEESPVPQVEEEEEHAKDKENTITAQTDMFFAKKEEYDFQRQGHMNRKTAMARLRPTTGFKEWENANKTQYACVHAKFYVSKANYRNFRKTQTYTYDNGSNRPQEREPLPSPKSIIDVKTAEKATLGTMFHATGDINSFQNTRRSNVRMKRLHLNDESVDAKPAFECKLYYRAEEVLKGNNVDGDEEILSDLDDESVDEEKILCQDTPLDQLKKEKVEQVRQWHSENSSPDKDEAEFMLTATKAAILTSNDRQSVEKAVTIYWKWYMIQEWKK